MKIFKRCMAVLAITFVCVFSAGAVGRAEEVLYPNSSDNTCSDAGTIRYSSLTPTSDGYMRVYCDETKVGIEYYDDDLNIKSKKTLDMELGVWGGFYAGEDGYYYIVEGAKNTAEDMNAEVIRVIKYDTDWNRIGAAGITSSPYMLADQGKVRYPFQSGCMEIAEYGDKLYIVTGHEGFVDKKIGQGHQGFLMIEVDKQNLTGEIVAADLHHSFSQYIKSEESDLYILELSEGERCTLLSKMNADEIVKENNNKNYSVDYENIATTLNLYQYGGTRTSSWAIPCYATVGGLELSANNVLGLGASIDQSQYDNLTVDTPSNIYLTVTPKSNFSEEATTVKYLTSYTGYRMFYWPKITKINDDRFLITWSESTDKQTADLNDTLTSRVLHYLFIDGEGNIVSEEFTAPGTMSDCQPIVKNGKVTFYTSDAYVVDFYTIDSNTGEFSEKSYRVVGDDNVTWEIDDGTLTVYGTGTIPTDAFKFCADAESITRISIKEGITGIGSYALCYLDYVKNLEIPSTVVDVGKNITACEYKKLFLVAKGSAAEAYVRDNELKYKIIGNNQDYIVLDYTSADIMTGRSIQLTGYSRGNISWTSSNPDIAAVDETGKVTGISEGKAVITAKNKYGGSIDCAVNVSSNGTTAPTSGVLGDYDNISWYMDNGTIYVSGTGEIPYRGFTQIMSGYNHLNVVIEDGISGVAKQAFYGGNVMEIVIPASVTSLGEDIAWTGADDRETGKHIYIVTIYAEQGSAAEQYAIDNEINYKTLDRYGTDITPGDVNGDTKINITDLMLVLNHVSGKKTLTGIVFDAADVTGDGSVDLKDLMKLLNYVSGKITKL